MAEEGTTEEAVASIEEEATGIVERGGAIESHMAQPQSGSPYSAIPWNEPALPMAWPPGLAPSGHETPTAPHEGQHPEQREAVDRDGDGELHRLEPRRCAGYDARVEQETGRDAG